MYVLYVALLLLTSCSRGPLSVQTEYWRQKDLASYIVDTPDPQKQEPIFGQRIRISWSTAAKDPLTLNVTIRLKNGDEIHDVYPLKKPTGELIVPVVGDNFTQKGGILSYKIILLSGSEVIAETHHRFWVELIKVE